MTALGTSLARAGAVWFGGIATNRRHNLMERHGIASPRAQATIDGKAWAANVALTEMLQHDDLVVRGLREASEYADAAIAAVRCGVAS